MTRRRFVSGLWRTRTDSLGGKSLRSETALKIRRRAEQERGKGICRSETRIERYPRLRKGDASMNVYEPLDLSAYCNAGVEMLGPNRTPAVGEQSLRGLPFRIGGDT